MSRVGPSTKSIFWIGSAFPRRTAAAAVRVWRVSGNVAFWALFGHGAMSDLSPSWAAQRVSANAYGFMSSHLVVPQFLAFKLLKEIS